MPAPVLIFPTRRSRSHSISSSHFTGDNAAECREPDQPHPQGECELNLADCLDLQPRHRLALSRGQGRAGNEGRLTQEIPVKSTPPAIQSTPSQRGEGAVAPCSKGRKVDQSVATPPAPPRPK